jgi:hypothetical protein
VVKENETHAVEVVGIEDNQWVGYRSPIVLVVGTG